ncbi:NADH-quinone oxidoreductase subunit NuoE [bacterium]
MGLNNNNKLNELKEFISTVKTKDRSESHLISVLHKAQDLYGYLYNDVIKEISAQMHLSVPHIWGVATFYHYFKFKPQGKYTISVCMGTACYVKGAALILDAIKEALGIEHGETTKNKLFTLQDTRCIGACSLAPAMMIDDKVYGHLTPTSVVEILKSYKL